MVVNFWDIFKTFFKVGTLLLGGGYVILPILESEIVQKKGWASSEDILEYFAISQSLPGIIAANVSLFVGYKVKGMTGAIAAITGIIAPAFLAIVLIANLMEEVINNKIFQNIFLGVGVGVVMLIILTVKEIWSKSVYDNYTRIVFMAALLLSCVKVNPVWIITGSILAGILFKREEEKDF